MSIFSWMTWNNGGPWGPPPGPKNSGGGNGGNPWNRGGNSGGPTPPMPPNLDELLKQLRGNFGPMLPKGNKSALTAALSVLGLIWLGSGVYQVGSNELGVVMRFGAFERTEPPGLRYHLPYPFEEAFTPVVTQQNETQVGFRRTSRAGDSARSVPEESMMLTQDENIINVEYAVFWRISDVAKFLFEIRDPGTTIKMAAESVMREVIGQNKLQYALTEGRGQIAEEAKARLQTLLDEYDSGIVVTQINLQTVSVPDEVKAAFQDVVNARLDQERFQNQATAHANRVIPEAKGQAGKLMQEAMAYRDQKIALAQGEADRFREVLLAYNASRDVTATRLYLETMEQVLGSANKVIIDKNVGGALPFFPLQDTLRKSDGSKP
jgi:membrane protease subunit HflK